MNLRSIAHALGGEVSSGQVLAPGPGHSKRDRSLSVRLSPGAPDGFLAFSHAGDDWRTCRDYVRQRLGVVTTTERQNFAASRNFKPASTPSPENRTRDAARRLFVEAIDPRETIGEHYLKIERRLGDVFDDVLALTLRFHPACPFRDGETLVRAPALIAARPTGGNARLQPSGRDGRRREALPRGPRERRRHPAHPARRRRLQS
ncbi:MAG: DUF7146 domain-containing protein [Methylocystis sp.]